MPYAGQGRCWGPACQWMGVPHIPFSTSLIHQPRASWRSCWPRPVRFLVVIGVAPVGVAAPHPCCHTPSSTHSRCGQIHLSSLQLLVWCPLGAPAPPPPAASLLSAPVYTPSLPSVPPFNRFSLRVYNWFSFRGSGHASSPGCPKAAVAPGSTVAKRGAPTRPEWV